MDFPIKLKLAAARVNAGFTQREVADKVGVNVATIARWENKGDISIKAEMLDRLCSLYKIPMQYIEIG